MDMWYLATLIGEPVLWLVITAAIALFYIPARRMKQFHWKKQYKKFAMLLIISMAISLVATTGLKNTVQLPRPCIPCPADECNQYCETGYSFPSGHASTIFAAFTALFLVLSRKKYSAAIFIIPLIISYSRLALGVHTAGDVLAGAAIGIAAAAAAYLIEKKISR